MAEEKDITRMGNPAKPTGDEGKQMLDRMNESHYEVTGWALDFFSYNDTDKVLDIGCGGGRTLHRLSKRIPNGHLTGVDYSPISVEQSRNFNAQDIDSGKMEVIEGNVASLPFTEGSFDKIITVESFYFWPDPQENLKEVHRVLSMDGRFLLVADIYDTEDLPESALENIKRYNMTNPTPEQFIKYFQNAGFTEIIVHLKEGTTWICVEGRK